LHKRGGGFTQSRGKECAGEKVCRKRTPVCLRKGVEKNATKKKGSLGGEWERQAQERGAPVFTM